MNKITEINVPSYVNYISDWKELVIPSGHFIMDKTITGCGFTEYFLRNSQNVILCSPRKILLENKQAQNSEIFYVKNEIEKSLGVDQELPKPTQGGIKKSDLEELMKVDTPEEIEEKKKYILQLKENISKYIEQRVFSGKPFKILVTYDSIKHVLEVLRFKFPEQVFNTFQFVVDEFQSIFTDSKFKGNVEMDFVDHLQGCNNVCFLSATPMIEKYLDRIEEFKDLPYYKLIWDSSKVTRAKITRKRVKSIIEECGKVIDLYRKGTYPRKIMEDKSIHESKEVVFYVNSVKTICSIIRKYKLNPLDTNIICSRDDKNKKKLRAIGFDFGSVPLKPEDNKMFTFCTRTVYLGADFYSHSAYTVVCSDCSIESLVVDISLDLPQILGRQRLKSNVFRNECLLFYKIQKKPITKDIYDAYLQKKRDMTLAYLRSYDKSLEGIEKEVLTSKVKQGLYFKYSIDYLGVKSINDTLAFNHLVELSEERAWEVSREHYQDDITVRRILEEDYEVEDIKDSKDEFQEIYSKFVNEFNTLTEFRDKMKLYCDFLDQYEDLLKTTDLPDVPSDYQSYVNFLGTKRIKSLSYQRSDLNNEINSTTSQSKIKHIIHLNYQPSNFYPSNEVKKHLQNIYDSLGIKKTAKATDLGEYFEIRKITKRIDGNPILCIELLKLKE